MKKFVKKEKGITLIALIITIIVMLILVAVTINVALNGGLFDKAKTASDQTQRQAIKEQLIATMIGAYDDNGNFNKNNVEELPEGTKWCAEADESFEDVTQNQTIPTNWIITKNGNKFFVDGNGKIFDADKVWQGRGLTFEKIQFDKEYNYATYDFIFYSNGSLYNGIVDVTLSSSDIQELIETGHVIVGNNYFLFDDSDGEQYIAIVFNGDNYFTFYSRKYTQFDNKDFNVDYITDAPRFYFQFDLVNE